MEKISIQEEDFTVQRTKDIFNELLKQTIPKDGGDIKGAMVHGEKVIVKVTPKINKK